MIAKASIGRQCSLHFFLDTNEGLAGDSRGGIAKSRTATGSTASPHSSDAVHVMSIRNADAIIFSRGFQASLLLEKAL